MKDKELNSALTADAGLDEALAQMAEEVPPMPADFHDRWMSAVRAEAEKTGNAAPAEPAPAAEEPTDIKWPQCEPAYTPVAAGEGNATGDRAEPFREMQIPEYMRVETGIAEFDRVLGVSVGDGFTVGAPYVEGAVVTAKAVKNGKGKKIHVLTYKPKKNEKRKIGHRQPYTKVQIETIAAGK